MFGKTKIKFLSRDLQAFPSAPPEAAEPVVKTRATPLLDRFVERNVAADQKPAIVSNGFVIRGEIEGTGTLHIEGVVVGSVTTSTVHISATGAVEGTLVCTAANVKGRFDGDLDCQELVVASTARLKGRFTYQQLLVQPGAVLDGELVVAASLNPTV